MSVIYMDLPLRYFMDNLASKYPVPGGGSVAALAGALAGGLVSMVANLTVDKEKYQNVQTEVRSLLAASETLRTHMQELVQKDTEVYGALSEVYKMPRNTDTEKTTGTARLQEALKKACQVPFEIAEKSLEIAKLAKQAAEIGNTAAISDAGIAVLLANACARSAALNARINLNSIKDKVYVNNTWDIVQSILAQTANLETTVMELTYTKMA